MASSVLGKRTRSSADAGEIDPDIPFDSTTKIESGPNSTTLRAKRQAMITIFNDENKSPFPPRQTRANIRDADSMELDELAEAPFPSKAASSKYCEAPGRFALSPAKIKTHFNMAKASSGECLTKRTG